MTESVTTSEPELGADGVAGFREAAAAIGDEDFSVVGAIEYAPGSDASVDAPDNLFRTGVDDGDGVLAAQGDVGGIAIGRESNAAGDGMAGHFDANGRDGGSAFRQRLDEKIVVVAGLADPQLVGGGPEGDAVVRRRMGLNFSQRGPGGAIEDVDAAAVENGEEMFIGIEGHVDGTALNERLAAPRAQQLIRGQKVKSAGLFAHRRFGGEDGKDSVFGGEEGGQGEDGQSGER